MVCQLNSNATRIANLSKTSFLHLRHSRGLPVSSIAERVNAIQEMKKKLKRQNQKGKWVCQKKFNQLTKTAKQHSSQKSGKEALCIMIIITIFAGGSGTPSLVVVQVASHHITITHEKVKWIHLLKKSKIHTSKSDWYTE